MRSTLFSISIIPLAVHKVSAQRLEATLDSSLCGFSRLLYLVHRKQNTNLQISTTCALVHSALSNSSYITHWFNCCVRRHLANDISLAAGTRE